MEEHPGSLTTQQSDEKQQRQQTHSPSPATVEDGERPTAPSAEFLAPKPIAAPPPESGRTSEKSETDETKVVNDSTETETSPRGPRVHPAASATPNPAAYYKQPDWASTCPTEAAYNVEVIKNGVPLTEDNVNLCSLSEEAKDAEAIGEGVRFCVFGRQPRGAVSPTDAACAKCVTMLHPSISRVHAILQYGSGPPTPTSQTASDQDTEPTKGWHIIDMNSTHGTFVNKRRAPPNRYIRLHVGYVIRLGNSTRLLILQGPETDVEQQTKESWSELVSAHQKRKAEQQLRESKLAQQDKEDSERQAHRSREGRSELQSSDQRDECTWGIDVDESQDDGEVGGAMMGLGLDGGSCLSHESSYADDPKRALKNYFDREGLDPPPQYEFVEGRFGQKNCRIELPTDTGTVYAEVPVSGNKRKEAIAACALEACRLLDRLGEFDAKEGADAVRKAHEKAYWEANDYYSSDEDPFLDRTGQLEQRRRKRMRRLGAPSAATDSNAEKDTQAAADPSSGGSLSVLSELEALGAEILKVEEELNEAERALTAVNENASELDELEAYMAAIKNGAPSRAARQALKQRLFELRQKELRLMRQLGIRQPTGFRGAFCSSASSSAAMAVRAALERKQQQQQQKEPDPSGDGCESLTEQKRSESKLNTLKRLLPSSIKVKISSSKEAKTEEFRPEFDEDEEEEDVPAPTNGVSESEASNTAVSRSTTVLKKDVLASVTALPPSPPPPPPPPPKPSECKVTTTEKAPKRTAQKTQPPPPPTSPPPPQPVEEATPTQRPPLGPQLPPSGTAELAVSSTVTESAPDSPQPAAMVPKKTVARPPESDEYDVTDPDYALWVPPQNQTGDGITDLNAKYGY
nr:unnamed protein product [Spirometra erinaceieuropaei]